MRLIAIIECPDYTDPRDVADSVCARLADEAGYLDDGGVVTPTRVHVYAHADSGKPLAHAESAPHHHAPPEPYAAPCGSGDPHGPHDGCPGLIRILPV